MEDAALECADVVAIVVERIGSESRNALEYIQTICFALIDDLVIIAGCPLVIVGIVDGDVAYGACHGTVVGQTHALGIGGDEFAVAKETRIKSRGT